MRYFLNILHTEGLSPGNSFSPTLGLCPIFVMDSLSLKIFFLFPGRGDTYLMENTNRNAFVERGWIRDRKALKDNITLPV